MIIFFSNRSICFNKLIFEELKKCAISIQLVIIEINN